MLIGEAASTIIFSMVRVISPTANANLLIADMKIVASSNLPSLRISEFGPIVSFAEDVPASGNYGVVGDIVYNSGTAKSANGWRRKTTGTAAVIGVDWAAF